MYQHRQITDHCCPVQKVVRVPVDGGRRHTLALTETKNVFSWGRGTSKQLGHGEIVDRNTPKMIDALSSYGSVASNWSHQRQSQWHVDSQCIISCLQLLLTGLSAHAFH
ncbi:hypothetical protein E2562_031591 [Oryza meyeriana var. granulata]|uniref:Uncharacterized protein n=1 Tax=Oryza meyeriana var. granulata TaxID=110450 RepID=A0A6G1CL91_9ORYZ|nr:hypothetical protein E2562_031591 [Oryza meyeriana var. granulata]KAF0900404.1 hypothetical protein E2562_031591 [Oryza meyeriana var. granulata]